METDFNHKQKGFSLPIAVFVLVIMALLAAALVQISSRSNLAAAQEELSNRAFFAAESGASWAMSLLFFNAAGAADKAHSDTACAAIGAGSPLSYTTRGLYTCTATIACSSQLVNLTSYYSINSQGRCGTGAVQGIRTIQVGAKSGS